MSRNSKRRRQGQANDDSGSELVESKARRVEGMLKSFSGKERKISASILSLVTDMGGASKEISILLKEAESQGYSSSETADLRLLLSTINTNIRCLSAAQMMVSRIKSVNNYRLITNDE